MADDDDDATIIEDFKPGNNKQGDEEADKDNEKDKDSAEESKD